MDIIYYIWLFDRRYVFRHSKWYIINQLNLTNYVSLLDKPLIVPRLFENAIFGYMVHFQNPAYKLIYTKLLKEEEEVHRIIFEKTSVDDICIYGTVYFIK